MLTFKSSGITENHPTEDTKPIRENYPYEIEQNADGLPLFPILDLEEDGPGVVRRVIEAYFSHLWSKSQ